MIAIIKYNAGNVNSVQNALSRLGYESVITGDENIIRNSDKIILPGVGEASSAMSYLKEKGLDKLILSLKQPILGICLGLQLMCKSSEEGDTKCLGIFDAVVKRFPKSKQKVPHTGWNNFESLEGELFKNIKTQDDVYYVHSYYAQLCEHTVATCDYIKSFSSAMQKDNFYSVQFHPEKSGEIGNQILKNFCELN